MKETELAIHIIEYLSDFDIYKEVPLCGIADIVAVKGNIITAIECKMCLNFEVIGQAVNNKIGAHYSYIAVPATKGKTFAWQICREYGIGILELRKYQSYQEPVIQTITNYRVYEVIAPKLNRYISKPKLAAWQKESEAGSQNNRMTAFKNTVRELQSYIERKGGCVPIKEAIKNIGHHYGSMTSANSCIINMCRAGVIKEFTYDKGFLILNIISSENTTVATVAI